MLDSAYNATFTTQEHYSGTFWIHTVDSWCSARLIGQVITHPLVQCVFSWPTACIWPDTHHDEVFVFGPDPCIRVVVKRKTKEQPSFTSTRILAKQKGMLTRWNAQDSAGLKCVLKDLFQINHVLTMFCDLCDTGYKNANTMSRFAFLQASDFRLSWFWVGRLALVPNVAHEQLSSKSPSCRDSLTKGALKWTSLRNFISCWEPLIGFTSNLFFRTCFSSRTLLHFESFSGTLFPSCTSNLLKNVFFVRFFQLQFLL